MPVKQMPTKYRASDGQEFDTKKEAERHDALVTARRDYEEARRVFGHHLARTQKTADGQPFDFGVFYDYYYISPGWSGRPDLSRVGFIGWNYEFEEADDSLIIRKFEHERWAHYNIRDLYYYEDAAKRALLAKQEEWLAEQQEAVAKLRTEIAR